MPDDTAKPVEPFTIELAGSELPQRILDRFPEPPPADARFIVTIEAAQDEAAKLDALRRDIEEGIADLDAGRVSDGEAVFARLRARFAAG
jgi:predicted transcriptional regulator